MNTGGLFMPLSHIEAKSNIDTDRKQMPGSIQNSNIMLRLPEINGDELLKDVACKSDRNEDLKPESLVSSTDLNLTLTINSKKRKLTEKQQFVQSTTEHDKVSKEKSNINTDRFQLP